MGGSMPGNENSVLSEVKASVSARLPQLRKERQALIKLIQDARDASERLYELEQLMKMVGVRPDQEPDAEQPHADKPQQRDSRSTPEKVLAVLRDAAGPMTPGEVAAKLREQSGSVNSEQVYSALSKLMHKRGKLSRSNREGSRQFQYWIRGSSAGNAKGGAS
jgi:hypothetical protein